MTDKISKVGIRPQNCDLVIFGDLFIGEVWCQTELVENKQEFIVLQWQPENELLSFLKNSQKGRQYLDKETGMTITKKYPKSRTFFRIAEKKWMVFTDWIGIETIDYGLDKRLIEKNETLEKENRQLRNEIGFLNSELERSNTRMEEQIKSWARRFQIVRSRRDDLDMGMDENTPQAGFIGSNG